MQFKKSLITSALITAGIGISTSAIAVQQGDWLMRVGLSNVSPNDGSSGVVADDAIGVDDNTQPSISFTYMYSDNVGVEILAALPFEHDITLDGSGKIADTKQLPPTVSVEYHFSPKNDVRPYVGAGINYTKFFSEDATAVISDISLDESWGLAVHAGVDVDINKDWFFNASVRYINIETTASTNIGDIDVDINPYVYTLGVGTTF